MIHNAPTNSGNIVKKTYEDGLREAAELLDVSRAQMLLAAGEMTAQEIRSVKAVLAWRKRVILKKADEHKA